MQHCPFIKSCTSRSFCPSLLAVTKRSRCAHISIASGCACVCFCLNKPGTHLQRIDTSVQYACAAEGHSAHSWRSPVTRSTGPGLDLGPYALMVLSDPCYYAGQLPPSPPGMLLRPLNSPELPKRLFKDHSQKSMISRLPLLRRMNAGPPAGWAVTGCLSLPSPPWRSAAVTVPVYICLRQRSPVDPEAHQLCCSFHNKRTSRCHLVSVSVSPSSKELPIN